MFGRAQQPQDSDRAGTPPRSGGPRRVPRAAWPRAALHTQHCDCTHSHSTAVQHAGSDRDAEAWAGGRPWLQPPRGAAHPSPASGHILPVGACTLGHLKCMPMPAAAARAGPPPAAAGRHSTRATRHALGPLARTVPDGVAACGLGSSHVMRAQLATRQRTMHVCHPEGMLTCARPLPASVSEPLPRAVPDIQQGSQGAPAGMDMPCTRML